ncbi:hypothetical protein WA026_004530 [Henosepilachna vigintioctopunctata]|uniref:Uncharacterized protein n=1 Tax=Henosepilachna vigintioctopunctata TaxID=420089 RepID=A0AAW1V2E7_9CUCU
MESANRKSTDTKTCDIPSPVLIRRRLSAPETVMRKYKLARAKSQESDSGQDQPKFCDLSYESHSGSDLNLQKKKESAVLMRKSTLLRRLMNNPKTLGSSSFQEWQHYCGKLSNSSLNSLQGSPEHLSKSYSRRSLVGYEFKTSPKHNVYGSRKVSPVRQTYEPHQSSLTQMKTSPKRRIDTNSDSYSNYHSNSPHSINGRIGSMSSQKTNANSDTPLTTSRTTIFKDHSDSTYSNERSNVTSSSISSSSTNTNVTAHEYARYRKQTPESISMNLDQRIVDENRNFPVNPSFNYITQESATQTASTTNLNVISNVKLSQKTLDLIVNEVMRDVQKTYTNGNEVVEKLGDSIHVGAKKSNRIGITSNKR